MDKFYFAETKDTQRLYVGVKGHVGFANIGDLKKSITYAHKYCKGKSTDEYNFYCVNIDDMEIEVL